MTDQIHLYGLRARGYHGVYDVERRQGQDFVIDAILDLDLAPAAATDDVVQTVHYGELAGALVAVVTGEPVNLIETLAARLVAVCLADPRVETATVTVHKPQAPIAHEFADVAVTLRRSRDDGTSGHDRTPADRGDKPAGRADAPAPPAGESE